MTSRQLRADLVLLVVTAIWGGTFVMVKDAVTDYPVFAFLAIRFALATAVSAPVAYWSGRQRRLQTGMSPGSTPVSTVCAGLLLGVFLFASYGLQTSGLQLTTPAKTGFITGLSVVIVPLLAWALWRKKPPVATAWGVGLATIGLGLLALRDDLSIHRGDLLVLGCALALAFHILTTSLFAPRMNPLRLLALQMLTVSVLCGVAALVWERPLTVPSPSVWLAAVITGVFASAFAFGAQTVAQQFTSATHTALIFVAEPVFAALFSTLVGREALPPRAWVGCGLILAGMATSEIGLTGFGRLAMWRRQRTEDSAGNRF